MEIIPEVAPLLVLGAVTGMRRGELVGIQRSSLDHTASEITVDTAIGPTGRAKGTKTRTRRTFHVDSETMAMLARHCEQMDERAALVGATVAPDAYVFSMAWDCSTPIAPDYFTKRVAVLKEHLGIASKAPRTIALENEALRLYSQVGTSRPQGTPGPQPSGGMSYEAIGARLDRSPRWAALAVASARRRDELGHQTTEVFDGSILALRKFTSSELLDAGFNISMVAQRQGHGAQVLVKHYAKSRRSADRKAAEHLGKVRRRVHVVHTIR